MADNSARIKELEDELSKTPYNKRTQGHIGKVKAQIARLREAQEASGGGGGGSGYQVRRTGDGTVILVGYPSAGKSTLLNVLTNQESEVGAYAFTTLTVIPGLLEFNGAQIQVLDVPGIVAGAASGKGRGKEVLATMRSADLCILLLDATRTHEVKSIRKEVYDAGIRLDEPVPDVRITKKAKDGISIGRTVPTPELSDELIVDMLSTFRIFNADVVIRSPVTADQFIDCIRGNRKYMPSLLVVNKIDLLSPQRAEKVLSDLKADLGISASQKVGIDTLKEKIFSSLHLIRVWMKEPGKDADLEEPLIIRKGSTIRDVAAKIHRDFERKFKFARVTGDSAKFPNQRQGLDHVIADNDIIELHSR